MWRTTPADLIGLDNSYLAWCFNNAIYYFGQSLESELESVKGDKEKAVQSKRVMILRRWLWDMPKTYRNPSPTR